MNSIIVVLSTFVIQLSHQTRFNCFYYFIDQSMVFSFDNISNFPIQIFPTEYPYRGKMIKGNIIFSLCNQIVLPLRCHRNIASSYFISEDNTFCIVLMENIIERNTFELISDTQNADRVIITSKMSELKIILEYSLTMETPNFSYKTNEIKILSSEVKPQTRIFYRVFKKFRYISVSVVLSIVIVSIILSKSDEFNGFLYGASGLIISTSICFLLWNGITLIHNWIGFFSVIGLSLAMATIVWTKQLFNTAYFTGAFTLSVLAAKISLVTFPKYFIPLEYLVAVPLLLFISKLDKIFAKSLAVITIFTCMIFSIAYALHLINNPLDIFDLLKSGHSLGLGIYIVIAFVVLFIPAQLFYHIATYLDGNDEESDVYFITY